MPVVIWCKGIHPTNIDEVSGPRAGCDGKELGSDVRDMQSMCLLGEGLFLTIDSSPNKTTTILGTQVSIPPLLCKAPSSPLAANIPNPILTLLDFFLLRPYLVLRV
jgi:hypothetical protein